MSRDAEVIVVGGGLAGIAAAVAVASSGRKTLHLAPKAPPDRRTSALMRPSVDFLLTAGLIDDPARLGPALTRIRIIDATSRLVRAPETLFDSREAGLDAFGWNFPNIALLDSFERVRSRLDTLTTVEAPMQSLTRVDDGWRLTLPDGTTLEAPLVVGSDGKKSLVRAAAGFRAREHGFTQAALVADLELARPVEGTSIEFHYPEGPFTLVPAGGNRANLVWIDDRELLRGIQASGKERFTELLQEKSQRLFGRLTPVTPAHMFLLSNLSVEKAGMDGVILAGEAAHAFPPIGAQGLNLGLRDVADLAHVIATPGIGSDWAHTVSTAYAERRATDLARTGGMVDTLFRSLLADFLPAQALRATGLWALKSVPALRKRAFSIGMGIG